MNRPELKLLRDQFISQNKTHVFSSVSSIRTEIRVRRKHIIGSHISLVPFVCEKGLINDSYVEELSRYLAFKTILLWDKKDADAEEFCNRFYTLAFYALASGKVGYESIDDVNNNGVH